MLEQLLKITIIGLVAGTLGTGIGGIFAFFIKGKSKRFLSFILEFSAGIMLAVVCFDLLPESFELGSLKIGIIGIIMGIASIVIADEMIKRIKTKTNSIQTNNFMRAGILLSIGIALHNLPEGVAIGGGFNSSMSLGLGLAMVISLHDIPEGLAMAVPLKVGGMSNWKIVLVTILSGTPTAIGALIGGLIGKISADAVSLCLGFAGGAMLYIVSGELIPEAKQLHRGRISTFGNIIGIICGIILSFYRN